MIELIVVIGIIILFMAVAVPAFNAITGRRSVAGAQNLLSAEVAAVRMRAIAQQRQMGLLIYPEDNGRIALRRCEVVDRFAGAELMIDLSPDADPVLLPAGVGMQFPRAAGAATGRYAGFIEDGERVARVMLFGPSGRVELTPYWYRARMGGAPTLLGDLLGLDSNNLPAGGAPTPEIGLLLYDRSDFDARFNEADTGDETAEEQWLDETGTLLILSRYNGTFVQEGK